MTKMSPSQYFLRLDVVVEPLVSRWYAWPPMVSPVTACLNIAYRYLPLIESFVSAPSAHEAACNDPKLRGSPFVDLPASHLEEMRELITVSKHNLADMLQFGSDLRHALRLVMKNADGFSIEKYYSELPDTQSALLYQVKDDAIPFAMSKPRLPSPCNDWSPCSEHADLHSRCKLESIAGRCDRRALHRGRRPGTRLSRAGRPHR